MNEEPDSPSNKIVTDTPDGTGSRKGRKALSAEEFSEVLDTVAGGKEQDPHALTGARDSMLEVAIGREVRAFRNKLGITASDLAKAAGLSLGGMLLCGAVPLFMWWKGALGGGDVKLFAAIGVRDDRLQSRLACGAVESDDTP